MSVSFELFLDVVIEVGLVSLAQLHIVGVRGQGVYRESDAKETLLMLMWAEHHFIIYIDLTCSAGGK